MDRPATRKVNGRVVHIPGESLSLRLVMAKVVDPKSGKVLSTWYLLTNVPPDVSTEQIALWYYACGSVNVFAASPDRILNGMML